MASMFKKKNKSKPDHSEAHENWLEKSVARKMQLEATAKNPSVPFDPYTFPLGEKMPQEVPAYVEVAAGSRNKYEWDQELGVLMLDRVLHSAMHYPNDYGFIPQTLCGDGDPLDILIMGTQPLVPGCVVKCRPIAYMTMEDEKGTDEKVLAVLSGDAMYYDVKKLEDLPDHKLLEISHFFETYKGLEKGKWAKVGAWSGTEDTYKLIEDTHKSFLLKEAQLEKDM